MAGRRERDGEESFLIILQSTGQNEAAVLELGEAFKALDSL